MSRYVGYIDWRNGGCKCNVYGLDFSQFQEPFCDYCKTNHERSVTYIVENDDKTLMQLGSDCVKKIMGYEPQEMGYSSDEMYDYWLFGRARGSKSAYTLKTLIWLVHFSEKNGYKTIDKSFKFDELKDYAIEHSKDNEEIIEKCKNIALKIVEYFKNIKPKNEFISNIKCLVGGEFYETKYFNILKYAAKIYHNDINYKGEYNSKNVDYESLTIKSIFLKDTYEVHFGYDWSNPMYQYIVVDTKNNVFELSSSKEVAYKQGDKITFKHKYMLNKETNIKEKMTYQSRKYGIVNKITRAKIL